MAQKGSSAGKKLLYKAYRLDNRRLKNKKKKLSSYCKKNPNDLQAKEVLDNL